MRVAGYLGAISVGAMCQGPLSQLHCTVPHSHSTILYCTLTAALHCAVLRDTLTATLPQVQCKTVMHSHNSYAVSKNGNTESCPEHWQLHWTEEILTFVQFHMSVLVDASLCSAHSAPRFALCSRFQLHCVYSVQAQLTSYIHFSWFDSLDMWLQHGRLLFEEINCNPSSIRQLSSEWSQNHH